MANREIELEEYDRDTLAYLTAAGLSPQLVERVNRLAKDKAHYERAVARASALLAKS